MPIIIEKQKLFDRFQNIDPTILHVNDAMERAVRELHIGIVNMMPDEALKKTEEQFIRPLHYASGGLQLVPHLIKVDGINRSVATQAYIDENYITVDEAQTQGMDALIVTGANVAVSDLKDAGFYKPLQRIIDWAHDPHNGPTSTIYSCLASHAYMQIKHQITRERLPEKRWGVFEHNVRNELHPLTHGMDTVFDIPHSRWNEISENQFRQAGMHVLVDSAEAGVHLATSVDGLRSVLWQGHPEYHTVSLLKEWQRDLGTKIEARLLQEPIDLPPYPKHYLRDKGLGLAEVYKTNAEQGNYFDTDKKGKLPPEIEETIRQNTPNRWSSSRRALLSNWVAAVLDKTHKDRGKPFMDGVDPENVFEKLER